MKRKIPLDDAELYKLSQLFQLDEDGLIIKFHEWLTDIMGDELLKHTIESVEKERHVLYRKLEYQGARQVHSMLERELDRLVKKSNK